MSFVQAANQSQKNDLERQQLAQQAAMNQARLDEMAFQRQRQEKSDWQHSYDKGMDEHANKYVFDLYKGNDTGGVDPSVIARVDPTKIMKIDEMRREQAWRDNTFGPAPGGASVGSQTSPSDPLAPKRPTGAAGGLDFTGAATAAGAPELAGFLPNVVQAESGGNPNAKAATSSARGLGQFTAATREAIMSKYGVDAWSQDPQEQLKALAYLAKDNRDGLASSFGMSPDKVTPQQIYMANFLGQGGANTFLKGMQANPNAPAVSLVSPEAAKANASIFYRQDNTPRTAQEVFDLMGNKVVAQAGQRTMSDASGQPPGVSQQGQGGYGGIINKALKLPVAEFTQWVMGAPKADREWLIGLYKQANPEAPSSLREFQGYMQMSPDEQSRFAEYKRLSKPETNVNVGDKKFDQTLGELWAKDYQKMFEDASGAQNVRDNVLAAKQLFATGLQTGALEPAKAQVSALAQSIGIDPNKLGLPDASDAQKFNAVVMKNLLAELVAQKGPQTEGDASRALKTFAQLGNTPEANQFALDYAAAVAQRKQEMAEYVYQTGRGKYEGDAFKAKGDWQKKINGAPLFAASPNTGKPVTYYQFKENALGNGVPAEQVDDAWRKFSGGK